MAQKDRGLLVKVVAIGYISLILLGNVWLSYALIAHKPPSWFEPLAFYCVAFTVFCSILLVGQKVFLALAKKGHDAKESEDA